jgi:predicted MPP superfamily phosphohydrolase
MKKVRILHITDLHYSSKPKAARDRLLQNFINDLKKQEYDIILFTGDIVNSGSKGDFESVFENFIKKIPSSTASNVFYCPGNHDVNRSDERKAITDHIESKVESLDRLNKFVKQNSEDLEDSFRPLTNYFDFVKGQLDDEDKFNRFYTSHSRKVNDLDIGIVSINTSWLALGRKDRGGLLFPIVELDAALDDIKKCELRILLHHHPIAYLKEFNEFQIEDVIHSNFDLSFSGHRHKSVNSIFITSNDGIVKIEGAAVLASDGAEIGYTIVEYDIDNLTFEYQTRLYDSKNEIFYSLPLKKSDIPTDTERKAQNAFRKKIRSKFQIELKKANDIFIGNRSLDESKTFLDVYTEPCFKNSFSIRTSKARFY